MNRHHFFIILIAILFHIASLCAWSDALPTASPEEVGLSNPEIAQLNPILQNYIEEGLASGVVGVVLRDGKIVYFEAMGRMDVQNQKSMQQDTLFRIASMTKPITSVAILKLVEEGKISLDDPISKYIPAFKNPTVLEAGSTVPVPAHREITIRHLLSHTSGVTYRFLERNDEAVKRYKEAGVTDGLSPTEGTVGENIEKLAPLPLIAHPGEAWEYGLSDDVLGYLVEIVTGNTFAQSLQERILDPLNMRDTYFFLPNEKVSRLARLYVPMDGNLVDVGEETIVKDELVFSSSYPYSGSRTYFSGGGGLCSTPMDYARFCQMLLNEGELDGVRILQPETVRAMTRNQIGDLNVNLAPENYKFGFGVAVNTGGGTTSKGEYGWSGFWSTYFWIDPQEKLIGIVMAQTVSMQPILAPFQSQVYKSILPTTRIDASRQH